jgi:predicted O-methyltransferase YrrM
MIIRDQIILTAEQVYGAILRVPARRKLMQFEPFTAEGKSLKTALLNALHGILATEEKAWIDRIEARRSELNSSKEEVLISDYGAGNPSLHLTAEEMYRGTQVREIVGDVSRRSSKSVFWALVLFRLIREMKPHSCLELGTALGISGCYQAAAVKLNGPGTLITLEGAASLAAIAAKGFQSLELDNTRVVPGRFQDTLGDVLRQYAPIDYALIDGHHDGAATWGYFEQIAGVAAETAILVFDDISWSRGMKHAWKKIISDTRISISFDLGGIGICLLSRRAARRQYLHIRMG